MRSLSARIVALQRSLDRILDSFWAWLVSLFSQKQAPNQEKSPPHTVSIETRKTMQEEPPNKRRWWKIPLEILAVLSAILGVAGFVVGVKTKLSVEVSGSLQDTNPFASVFVLKNDGALAVHKVLAACGEPQFKAGQYSWQSETNAKFIFGDNSRAKVLSPGHHMTLPCGHMFGFADPATVTEAKLTIIVDYRPDWTPWWHRTARFPWKAEKTLDGKWLWDSLPQ